MSQLEIVEYRTVSEVIRWKRLGIKYPHHAVHVVVQSPIEEKLNIFTALTQSVPRKCGVTLKTVYIL